MEIINFYKDTKGFYVLNNQIRAANSLHMRIENDVITITDLNYKVIHTGTIDSILDINGVPYATIDDLTDICGDLFIGVDNALLLEAIRFSGGVPTKFIHELTRPADTAAYLAGDGINVSTTEPVAIEFANVGGANGGGYLAFLKVESNITALAGATLRLWFFNDTPTGIVNDNAPYTNSYANSSKRVFYVDITFDALLAGSDTVFGQSFPIFNEYVAQNLYCLIQTLTAFTPTSGGKIKISLSCVKIA
jgi:hypothetical protein